MNESDVQQIECDLRALEKQIWGFEGVDPRLEELEDLKLGDRVASLEAVIVRLAEMVGRVIGVLEQARHGDAAERAEPESHDADAAPELTEEP